MNKECIYCNKKISYYSGACSYCGTLHPRLDIVNQEETIKEGNQDRVNSKHKFKETIESYNNVSVYRR